MRPFQALTSTHGNSRSAAFGTRTGLKVDHQLDEHTYPNKIRVSDDQLAAVQIDRLPVDPWNCTIKPRT